MAHYQRKITSKDLERITIKDWENLLKTTNEEKKSLVKNIIGNDSELLQELITELRSDKLKKINGKIHTDEKIK